MKHSQEYERLGENSQKIAHFFLFMTYIREPNELEPTSGSCSYVSICRPVGTCSCRHMFYSVLINQIQAVGFTGNNLKEDLYLAPINRFSPKQIPFFLRIRPLWL